MLSNFYKRILNYIISNIFPNDEINADCCLKGARYHQTQKSQTEFAVRREEKTTTCGLFNVRNSSG